jgi:signal transduction histidine kinase
VTAPIVTARALRLTRSRTLRDLLVALVAYGLTLAVLHGLRGATRHLDLLGAVLAAVACFPLLARRRSPLGVFVVTAAASAALNGLGYGLGPPFGPTVALFFVAMDERTRARIRQTASVVLVVFAAHVGSTLIDHGGFPTSPVLFGILVWGGAWVVGDQVRHRRHRHAELVERAERNAREARREQRLAVAEERTRIARDLHDSAAHAINVILVQAGAARLLQQENPDATRDALTTIENVARETIGEIDQLVRTLRENSLDGEPEPPTGLAALETLLDRSRTAGLTVTLDVAGTPRPLPPATDQAAYRILQESLTNAARHGTGTADVAIGYSTRSLELTVTNPLAGGEARRDGEAGHGVLGMRERATLLAGTLDASREGTQFRVRARLPLNT